MENEQIFGPILSEEKFFTLLDTSKAELAEAQSAYSAGDVASARHLFAEYVRKNTDSDRFFDLGGKEDRPEVGDFVRKMAEDAMGNLLSSCGEPYQFGEEIDWFANPTFNQYAEWTWQLTRHGFIGALAAMYAMTDEEKYAEKAVWYLLSWIRQAVRPEDGTSPYATLCWRTIECGLRLQCWVDNLHKLMRSPAMSDEAICLIFRSIYETCHRLRVNHAKGTNWLVMEMTGLSKVSMVYPVFAESEEFLAYSVDLLNEAFYQQMHPDGFQYELTTEYHRVVVNQCMVVANLIERYGKRMDDKFYQTIENAMMLYLKLSQSGFTVPDLSDGNEESVYNNIKLHVCDFPNNESFKYIMSEGKEGKITLPTSLLLENSGIVTSRDAWKWDSISFLFDAGKLGSNHQHEDKLNLLIGAFGKICVAEGRRYAYDSSDIRKYSLATASHNTVLVDGMGQNRKKGYKWQPEMLTSVEDVPVYFSEKFDYARGVYNEGYGEEALPLATHTREVIFVKKPEVGAPYIIAIDTLVSDEERTYESLWHYDTKQTVAVNDNIISYEEMTTILLGELGEISIVKGQAEPTVQGFICRSTKQGDYEPIPTLVRKNFGKCVKIATLFAPTKDGICDILSADFDGDLLTIVYKGEEIDKHSLSCKSNTFSIKEIRSLAK